MLMIATEVDRKVALSLLVPLILSALIVVYVTVGAATLEFTYAEWTRTQIDLPPIIHFYRCVYRWAWVLPIAVAGWSIILVRKQFCSLGHIIILAGTECVLLTMWSSLTLLAFYLCNQTFFLALH